MMKKIKKWFNKKAAILSLALGNVEKNTLGQKGEPLNSDVNQTIRNTKGQLADSLVNGEVTQEVMDLRWRTYKILRESGGVFAEIVGYDEEGFPIVKTKKINKKRGLSKVKLDSYDNYPLELVLDNTEISIGGNDAMENENITIFDSIIENYNDNNELISVTHGEIDSVEYFATNKSEVPLKIIRNQIPKFRIETYTKKLNVRKIDEEKRLLEFYVSKYPDEYDRTSRLFLSDLKKTIEEPNKSTIIEFQKVNFVSYKTMGSDDFLEYEYEILSYDKIIDFNGHYVIKFIAKVIENGKDILETYKMVELDKKYELKAKKR
jgi:hypothetical protein